jgi:hypothetical protein
MSQDNTERQTSLRRVTEILRRLKSRTFSLNFCFVARCLCCNQRAVVGESGLIRTEMGCTTDQNIAAVHGTLCKLPFRNRTAINKQSKLFRDIKHFCSLW